VNNESSLTPEAPRLVTAYLPPAGGTLGSEPEHFRVSEKALYEPSGTGEHLYVRVEKRGMTTPELVHVLSRVARVRDRDIGHAGLKDKHAITEQWLSLPGNVEPPESWELPEGVRVLASSRHGNKLRTGHLRGNHFAIVLTGVTEGALERARAILETLQARGLYNYFGEQRFGRGGSNLERALEWLERPPRRGRKERFYSKLYPSVVQSEIFNRYLGRRAARGLDRLIGGEVVRLAGTGSCFVVEHPEVEQPRLDEGDLVLTGPMVGPKAKPALGPALELEAQALGTLGLEPSVLERLARQAPGTRRDLVVPVEEASLAAASTDSLELRFFLPAGCYATQLIREFTRAPWLAARQSEG
jgi:tRNA pseudouridine13 synthase